MKRAILCLLVFHISVAAAQQVNQCGIIIPPQGTVRNNFTSVNEAATIIRNILSAINWKENFTITEQTGINNAYATIIRNKRFIIYDNNFLTNLDAYAGTRWASVSVLAHEMGHHYLNHTVTGTSSTPAKELEADYFSGYVLEKLGATIAEAAAAMQAVSPVNPSRSHPGRTDRVSAIRQGWNYAVGGQTTAASEGKNPTPQPQQNPPPNGEDAKWINLYLYANQEMTVYLSDDGNTYNPARLKPTQPFVFKYEIHNYGWMRFTTTGPRYRLVHGKDYSIIWNRRANNWTVVEVE